MKIPGTAFFILCLLTGCDSTDSNVMMPLCGTVDRNFPGIPGWNFIAIPDPPVISNSHSLHFFDESNGLIFLGEGIWKTKDQGQSWYNVYQSSMYISTTSHSFLDNLNGFASIAVNKKYSLLFTSNGGESWTTINYTPQKNITSLAFISPLEGFASFRTSIQKTTDGGRTWNKIDELSSGDYLRVFISDNGMGYVVNSEGLLFVTFDKGMTWDQLQTPVARSVELQFISHDTLFIKGDDKLFKSIDGGLSWEDISKYNVTDFVFLNSNEGLSYQAAYQDIDYDVVVDCSAFLTTMDGGISWEEGSVLLSVYPKSIQLINPNLGFILTQRSGFQIVKIYR